MVQGIEIVDLRGNLLTGTAFPPAWLRGGALPRLKRLELSSNFGLGGALPASLPWSHIQDMWALGGEFFFLFFLVVVVVGWGGVGWGALQKEGDDGGAEVVRRRQRNVGRRDQLAFQACASRRVARHRGRATLARRRCM